MGKPAEHVTPDRDVEDDLRKVAERSGRPLDVLANAVFALIGLELKLASATP